MRVSNTKDGLSVSDFYEDTRSFLMKANSTKFILVVFVLTLTPILLYLKCIGENTFSEIVILVTLAYLGADVFDRKNARKVT